MQYDQSMTFTYCGPAEAQTTADLLKHNCRCYCHTISGTIFRWEFTSPEVDGHDFVVEPHGTSITNDEQA
jgi:hypothetical protein